jgi:ADP-ribosylglycohydrolase
MNFYDLNNIDSVTSRAQGCLVGQLAGDALGSLVEFQSPEKIRLLYPDGVRNMADGGTWNNIAGQPTDDSEMALLLARMLIKNGCYNSESARKEYLYWLNSNPFDCGITISAALRGKLNPESQANGAMMRISPLGIFGINFELSEVVEWAIQDAVITHPNLICQQANALFITGIFNAVKFGCSAKETFNIIRQTAIEMKAEKMLLDTIEKSFNEPPANYLQQQGWVLIAFQNALYQLLHTKNPEEGIINTIMCGGDTDTNAAIFGALSGAVYGQASIPAQWLKALQNCRPEAGKPGVFNPRPECLWPVDVLELAEKLIQPNLTVTEIFG